LQDVVSVQNLGGETPDRKAQLRNDMELLQKSVADRKKRLADLEKRLKQSQNYNEEMRKTIETMKQQLENQQATIDDLTKQLAQAHIVINTLNTRVDSLNTVNNEVREETARAKEETTRVTNEMNVCYYAIGNKKELKQNHIIETGFLKKTKIMEGDYEKSYFTKADKRTLSNIPLHSKKAKLLSKHPAGTYQIVDEGGTKSLHITDPGRFWELSNYLIVQID
jgi:chromosome segregation ATPase